MRIAFFAMFAMALASLVAAPAQAKFALLSGYRYVYVPATDYGAHVAQLDFRWTLPNGKRYAKREKKPYHTLGFSRTLGFALALGGDAGSETLAVSNASEPSVLSYTTYYVALPVVYEYVFPGGLGFSLGITVPFMMERGKVGGVKYEMLGGGFGLSNLGLSQHFRNGLVLYAKSDIGYAFFRSGGAGNAGNDVGLMWAAGAGIGYWF